MIKYIKVADESLAKTISRELFRISKPTNAPDDVTQYLFGWIVHPTTGEVALAFDPDLQIKVHPSRDVSVLVDIVAPNTPDDELQRLLSYVKANNVVTMRQLLPSWVILYDHADLEQEGWFQNEPEATQ